MGQGSCRAHRLTCAERLELQRRVRAGETHEVAATAVGCSAKSVQPPHCSPGHLDRRLEVEVCRVNSPLGAPPRRERRVPSRL